jgi:hypothetical protein
VAAEKEGAVVAAAGDDNEEAGDSIKEGMGDPVEKGKPDRLGDLKLPLRGKLPTAPPLLLSPLPLRGNGVIERDEAAVPTAA